MPTKLSQWRSRAINPTIRSIRYSGYCAWRGVFDFTGKEGSETVTGIRRAYPELGNCLYFDLAHKTHAVLYELPRKRLNWLWYINGPEPELTVTSSVPSLHRANQRSSTSVSFSLLSMLAQGNSVTLDATEAMVSRMRDEAARVWCPELARLIRDTARPFVNVIYDADPLPRLAWAGGRVALVGDAAHPTTPHGLRSTNMSVLDARVLGACLARWEGARQLPHAMAEYEAARLPIVAAQVLHARRLGRVKQGLPVDGKVVGFDLRTSTVEEALQLRQRTMPFFEGAPTADDSSL